MSDRNFVKWPVVGCFAYFLRAGDTVDSVTVAAEAKPDFDPTSNWPGLGVVKGLQPYKDEVKHERMVPLSSGGHRRQVQTQTVEEGAEIEFAGISDIALELMFGLAKLTGSTGAAQIPGNVRDRKVQGWLVFQAREDDGTDLAVGHIYVECRMATLPKLGTTGKVESTIRCQLLESTLNTILLAE
jgi:hypothetical protein